MFSPSPLSPKAPQIHVTHPNVPFGSHDNLVPDEDGKKSPAEGVDNPVFAFDNVSLLSRSEAPSRCSDPIHESVRVLPPLRRGSYSPYLSSTDMDSLTVPGNSPGVRRSSLASTWSRDSGLSHRRLKPISSLSINDMACEAKVQPLPSPGLLSTHSMWSTSDLFSRPGSRQQDADAISNLTNSNSLSNVSSTLSDRMHELVRAFSSRTQRTKEKTTQPPSPSSVSSQDAKSAISALEDEDAPAPRNIRLGSFIPMGSRTSEAFSETSEAHKEMLVGVWQCRFRMPKCLRKIRFPNTIEAQSKLYVSWLFIVMLAYMYNAWVIPLRGFFPYQTPSNVWYWLICDYTCDLIYILDIAVFKVRIRFVNDGIIECDRKLTKKHYMKKLMFKLDVFSLLPLDLIYLVPGVGVNPWLRIPRLFKVQTFWEFYERCDQAANSSAHAIRIIKTFTYMLFLIHIETCGYYAVSVYEGFDANQWVYNGSGNAYIRCFYLATKTATSIGNNPKPQNELEYMFMTLYWLSGVFVFALLIGQIRDIVEAAGHVKAAYRKKIDMTVRYMESINIPKEMQERVRVWFLYNWEQTKTVDEGQLLETLPRKLQTDLAISVHFNTLSKVQLFQDCDKNLLYDLVLKLKPSLFLPQDYICYKGEVGKEMYIVSEGQVEVVGGEDGETVLATLHEGSVFGEISLLAMSGGNRRTANVRSKGFTNVFTLSKADFEEAMREYPEAQKLLRKRAKKLLKENARLEKKSQKVEAEEIIKTPSETPKFVKTVIKVMDPESNIVRQLDPSMKGSSMRSVVSRSSSARSSRSSHGRSTPSGLDRKPSKKAQATFVFGSEISLNDIPDDQGGESLSEDDELLVVEREERILSDVPVQEIQMVEDKRKQVLKDDLDKTNNSLESQDSGIPSMKRSASQSTDKSLSNQDSKDSFNTADLMGVINEEKTKSEEFLETNVDTPLETHQSPSGSSGGSDIEDAEKITVVSATDKCIPGETVDGIQRKMSTESKDGTNRKLSTGSQDNKSFTEDGTLQKTSVESIDGTLRKTSTESMDGTWRKTSAESIDGTQRKTSAESDGTQRKTSAESIDGTQWKTSAESIDGTQRKTSAESIDGNQQKTSAESIDGTRRKTSAESIDGTRRKTSAESIDGTRRKFSTESRDGTRRKASNESKDGTRRKTSTESKDGTRPKMSNESKDGTRQKTSNESKEGKSRREDGTRRKTSSESRRGAQSPEGNGAQSPGSVLPNTRGDNSVTEKHEIPLENKVTCAVEIHREKTRTPSSIFSLEHQERPGSNSFYRQNSNVSYETEL